MHEMSLCESLVGILEDQAKAKGYKQVKQVWLEVGAFSGVEIPSLIFCFDVVCRTTLAEGSKLNIIELPGQANCFGCGKNVEVSEREQACPECGAYQLVVSGGTEFRIKELEVV